jgi:hypothetical protein
MIKFNFKRFWCLIFAIIVLFVVGISAWFYVRAPKDIFDAAWKGDLQSVKSFVAKGINVNTIGEVQDIPLHFALTKEVAEFLIANGSNIEHKNSFGGTPLHMAAVNGRFEVAKVLLQNGADVNARDIIGGTPLDHALVGQEDKIQGNHEAVIKLLKDHGGKSPGHSPGGKLYPPNSPK